MAITVYSRNVANGLEHWEQSLGLMDSLEQINPDVALYLEATSEAGVGSVEYQRFLRLAKGLGYLATPGMYGNNEDRDDTHSLLLLHKAELGGSPSLLRHLNAVELRVQDPETDQPLTIVGAHVADRKLASEDQAPSKITTDEHQAARLTQVEGILEAAGAEGARVIMGDLNDMPADNWIAKTLRSWPVRKVAAVLPKIEPGANNKAEFMAQSGDSALGKVIGKARYILARVGSLSSRLSVMAEGALLQRIENAEYRDADTEQRRGTMNMGPFTPFQLDHIMASSGVTVEEFDVLPNDGLSDHRGLLATIKAV